MQLDDGFQTEDEGPDAGDLEAADYLATCVAEMVIEHLRPLFEQISETMVRGVAPMFITLGEELDRRFTAQLALSQELVDLLQRAVDESSTGPS